MTPARRWAQRRSLELRVIALAWAGSLVLMSAPWSASAQEEAIAEPIGRINIDEARRHFEQGVALFREDDVDAALAEFRASYRLNPVAPVLFNIAVSQRRLHRYAAAVETLRRYLDEGVDESRERRALATDLIGELEAILAWVRLEVDQREADVFVDGELLGRTPLASPLRLASGDHELEVHLDGFRTHRQRIEVQGGQDLELAIEMRRVSRPWYRRWWVWTLVGAAVVGTSVGLAVGLGDEPAGTELEVLVERGGP